MARAALDTAALPYGFSLAKVGQRHVGGVKRVMSGESMSFAQATPKWQKPRLVKYFTWKSTVSTELQRLDMERGLIEKELDAMVPQDSPQMTSALDATRTRVLTRSATARA